MVNKDVDYTCSNALSPTINTSFLLLHTNIGDICLVNLCVHKDYRKLIRDKKAMLGLL